MAMDSIDSSVFECYEALFDLETDDWNQSVQDLYKDQIMGLDVLFIQSIELNANYRGKGIGAQVVRETIATFGSHCGLIACKPFPLQYSNWEDEEHIEMRQQPRIEERRGSLILPGLPDSGPTWVLLGWMILTFIRTLPN